MNLKGIFFDLDGTVADSLELVILGYKRTLEHYLNRPFSEKEIVQQFGPSEAGVYKRLVRSRWRECVEFNLDVYRKNQYRESLFKGIDVALVTIRKEGLFTAIVTGRGEESARMTLEHLNLTDCFDAFEYGSPDGQSKKRGIRRILKEQSFDPNQVAFVGDTKQDMISANDAGVTPLGAAWDKRADAAELKLVLLPQKNIQVFRRVAELTEWIRQQSRASGSVA